jgi:hypothetical protein
MKYLDHVISSVLFYVNSNEQRLNEHFICHAWDTQSKVLVKTVFRLDDEADELAAAQHDLAECFEDREQFLLDSIHNSSSQVSLFRNDEHDTASQQSSSSTCSNADADDEWSLDRLSSFDEKQEKTQRAGGRQKPVYSTSTTCSDSGHVSDGSDSKNGSADRFSFTDSAIDSSTESKAKIRNVVQSAQNRARLSYQATRLTDFDSYDLIVNCCFIIFNPYRSLK